MARHFEKAPDDTPKEFTMGDPEDPSTWKVVPMDAVEKKPEVYPEGDPNDPSTWMVVPMDAVLVPRQKKEVPDTAPTEAGTVEHHTEASAPSPVPDNALTPEASTAPEEPRVAKEATRSDVPVSPEVEAPATSDAGGSQEEGAHVAPVADSRTPAEAVTQEVDETKNEAPSVAQTPQKERGPESAPVSHESFPGRFMLQKNTMPEGNTSLVPTGWQSEVFLQKTPEVGQSLYWIGAGGGYGSTSPVSKIETLSEGVWRIHTATSVYELHRAPEKVERDPTKFNVEEVLRDPRTPAEVITALQEKEFQPIDVVEIEGYRIFMSPVIRGGSRDTVIGYVFNNEGVAQLRLYYQSRSDGGWRLNAPDNHQSLSKGIVHQQYGYRHYSRECKPHEDLVGKLEQLAIHRSPYGYDKQQVCRGQYKNQHNLQQYMQETTEPYYSDGPRLPVDFPARYGTLNAGEKTVFLGNKVMRGQIYAGEKYTFPIEDIHSIEYPSDFIPDFSRDPIRTYYQSHTIFSSEDTEGRLSRDVRIEVYESTIVVQEEEKDKLYWHMATSPQGKVWVEKIVPESSKVNSYGTYNRVIDFGILDLKPVDYWDQVPSVPDRYKTNLKGWDGDYTDITPFLGELLPIKLYRQYRVDTKDVKKVA